MRIGILGLFLLILFVAGCATMPAEKVGDIKDKIIKANTGINSFKFKSTNELAVSKGNETLQMVVDVEGLMDRSAKKMKVTGNVDMGKMKMPVETYADGQFVYSNTMGKWVKMKMKQDMFEAQDQSKYLIEFLKSSEIKAEEAEVDGRKVYKVKVTPDKEALLDLVRKNSPVPLQSKLKAGDFVKDVEITYFINKENFIAEKADIKYSLDLDGTLMKTVTKYEMFDVDKPVDIALPEAAKDAIDYEDFQKQMMEQIAAQQANLPVQNQNISLNEQEAMIGNNTPVAQE